MLVLALAVLCSLGVVVLFKLAERRDLDRMALLTVNYAAAAVLAAAFGYAGRGASWSIELISLGVVQGGLFVVGFWLLSRSIRAVGIGVAAGVMRLSVVVPVLASWMIWSEVPSKFQGVGLALAGGAFFLIARPGETPGPTDARAATPSWPAPLLLVLLFVVGGAADTLNKAFAEGFSDSLQPFFLLLVFGVAFGVGCVATVVTSLRAERWPSRNVVVWGLALGALNYGSVDFLLQAVRKLSGPFVFPANNVLIVVGAAVLGRALWEEPLSFANWVGLGVAAVALVLLRM